MRNMSEYDAPISFGLLLCSLKTQNRCATILPHTHSTTGVRLSSLQWSLHIG